MDFTTILSLALSSKALGGDVARVTILVYNMRSFLEEAMSISWTYFLYQ